MRLLLATLPMFALLGCALTSDPGATSDGVGSATGDGGGGGGHGQDPPIECGFNAHQDGDSCECDGEYSWCDVSSA